MMIKERNRILDNIWLLSRNRKDTEKIELVMNPLFLYLFIFSNKYIYVHFACLLCTKTLTKCNITH